MPEAPITDKKGRRDSPGAGVIPIIFSPLNARRRLPFSTNRQLQKERILLSGEADEADMAERPGADTKPKCTPAELMLKVILTGTLSHYETRGMIDDKRLEHMLSAGKQILYKTHQESDVRYGLLGLTRLSYG